MLLLLSAEHSASASEKVILYIMLIYIYIYIMSLLFTCICRNLASNSWRQPSTMPDSSEKFPKKNLSSSSKIYRVNSAKSATLPLLPNPKDFPEATNRPVVPKPPANRRRLPGESDLFFGNLRYLFFGGGGARLLLFCFEFLRRLLLLVLDSFACIFSFLSLYSISSSGSKVDMDLLQEENNALIHRITEMQQSRWKMEERIKDLESLNATICEDLAKKQAVIREHVMNSKTGEGDLFWLVFGGGWFCLYLIISHHSL